MDIEIFEEDKKLLTILETNTLNYFSLKFGF